MLTFRSLALLAAATVVAGQTLDPALGDCALTCYNNVKAQSGTWATPCPADNMKCICQAGEFKNGVHDCAAQCPGGVDFAGTVLGDLNKICSAAITPEAPPQETAVATPPEATPTTTLQEEVNISATAVPTSQAPVSQPAEPTATVTSETSAPAATGTAPTTTSSEDAVAAKPTEPSTTSTTPISDAESTPSSTPETAQSSEPAGLTTGAKAGIAIGAVAGVAALAGLGFWFFIHQRRNKRANGFSSKHMIKISDPAPGGGRTFAGDHHYETGLSELEMKSRRYEDMIPRQQPRHMV
ncbi:hypothetical protein V8F20_003165 [Naviculisporaceae sp. PSN 640]